MKILKLRLQNLNSLQGKTEIDFEQPPLSTAGLFAITGPTGAGKSTLLDGITLALYGRAARYGTQASPEEMMSRGTGACFAEVEFLCSRGRFLSSWHLHRAKNAPSGKVQPVKRRVVSLPGGEAIADKTEESLKLIESLTGLDYERFLRSVMLAQGDFAAFLRAKPGERASLLEAVTGTSIYRDISIKAYKRCDEAKAVYEQLLSRGSSIQVMDTEERAQKLDLSAHLSVENQGRRTALQALQQRLQAVVQLERCLSGLARQQAEEALLNETILAKKPLLDRLHLAEQARPFEPALQSVQRSLDSLNTVLSALHRNEEQCPALMEQNAKAALAHTEAEQLHASLQANQERNEALWLQVQALDGQLAGLASLLTKLGTSKTELERALEQAQETSLAAEAKVQANAESIAKGLEWLETHRADAGMEEMLVAASLAQARWSTAEQRLIEGTAACTKREKSLQEIDAELFELEKQLNATETELVSVRTAAATTAATLQALAPQGGVELLESNAAFTRTRAEDARLLQGLAARLRSSLLSVASEKERIHASAREEAALKEGSASLVLARDNAKDLLLARRKAVTFAERCSSLVAQRSELTEGAACPLCGSVHHPWEQEAPIADEELNLARREEAAAELALTAAADKLATHQKDWAVITQALQLANAQLRKAETAHEELCSTWSEAIASFNKSEVPGYEAEADLRDFQSRCVTENKTAEALLKQWRDADSALKTAHARLSLVEASAAQIRSNQKLQRGLKERAQAECVLLRQAAELAKAECIAAQAEALALSLGTAPVDCSNAEAYAAWLKAARERAALHTKALVRMQSLQAQEAVLAETVRATRSDLLRLTEEKNRLCLEVSLKLAEQAAVQAQRQTLFGVQTIDKAREEARNTFTAASNSLHRCRSAHEEAQRDLDRLLQELERLRSERQLTQDHYETSRISLLKSLTGSVFSEETQLREALLNEGDFSAYLRLRADLDKQRALTDAEKSRLQEELAAFDAKVHEDKMGSDALKGELDALELSLSETAKAIGALEERIRSDDTARATQSALLVQTSASHKEYARWDALRALIGSSDGSIFSRFAQGLTLDHLAALANVHLRQLNPRYGIRREKASGAQALELEIIDYYQAGATRPMGSLSGGESFLVSLSLALGLSELASGRSSIESLFIDEGFGTLDSATLDAAMSALESLQASGKIIGVISHVAAMQERIGVQIQVIKETAGCSRVALLG